MDPLPVRNGCVACCSCGTPNSGSGWVSLNLFSVLGTFFPLIGLPHPVLIWGAVPIFVIVTCLLYSVRLISLGGLFSEGKQRRNGSGCEGRESWE